MSIEARCLELENDDSNNPSLLAYTETTSIARRLYLTRSARSDLNPNGAIAALSLRPSVKVHFDKWVSGEYLLSDGRKRPGFIKRLDEPPPEIWCIRITAPSAKVRAFGRFLAPDALIVTRLVTRNFLGRKGSQAWTDTCNDCVAQWTSLFPENNPLTGKTFSDYVTGDCDEFVLGRVQPTRG